MEDTAPYRLPGTICTFFYMFLCVHLHQCFLFPHIPIVMLTSQHQFHTLPQSYLPMPTSFLLMPLFTYLCCPPPCITPYSASAPCILCISAMTHLLPSHVPPSHASHCPLKSLHPSGVQNDHLKVFDRSKRQVYPFRLLRRCLLPFFFWLRPR